MSPYNPTKSRETSDANRSKNTLQIGQLSRPQSSSSLSAMDEPVRSRRTSRNTSRQVSEDQTTYSQQSILSAMDRFVESVNNMVSTVLVPSKLKDMDVVGEKTANPPPPTVASTDLFSFYNMLNEEKNNLLWGSEIPQSSATSPISRSSSNLEMIRTAKFTRRSSEGSIASSVSLSDPESDSDVDSVSADPGNIQHSLHLAAAFRYHLQGLHSVFHQLADTADYLAGRYQEEVDA